MTAEKRGLTEKQKKIIGGIAIAVYALLTVWIFLFVGKPMLRFVSEPDRFRDWVDTYGFWSRIAYIGMVFLQVFIAVIPGEPLEIGGGYAFGSIEGTLLCLTGAVIGSILVFAFVRYFGIRLVEVFYPKEKIQSLKFLRSSPKRNYLFFLLFVIPGTPKDLLCYFAGLTDMRWSTWIFISTVGRIPSIITSTIGGDALGTKNYLFAVVAFAVTLAVSLAGLLVYQGICRRNRKYVKLCDGGKA